MIHRTALTALALGLLLAAAAAGQHHAIGGKVDYDPDPVGGDPHPPEGCAGVPAKITIGGSTSFAPATITVDAGQPVCWTWTATGAEHNIKADNGSFTSGPPAERGTFQYTFTAPGTYGYYCQVHGTLTAGMRGRVVVRDTSGGGGGGGQGAGQLAISPAYTVNEGAGSLTVTVERMGGSDGAATVKFATANGTAKSGKDFLPRAGTLKWVSGDQAPKTIQVPIKNDSAPESDETFGVKLSKATGATMSISNATVTIHDDDSPGCGAGVAAPLQLRAQGQSPSEIRLTWADESAAASSFVIERRQPDGVFREIASLPAASAGIASFTDSGLPGGATFQYRVRTEGIDGVSAFSAIAAGATDGSTAACDAMRALCLQGGRFEATVEWRPSEAEASRQAKRVMLSETTGRGGGLFSFAPHDSPQLLLNVSDGCAVNGHYGLSLAAVTDAELTVKVRDTQTGRTWVYFNPEGSAPAPVRDADAFATCP
jgi:plastocyanin